MCRFTDAPCIRTTLNCEKRLRSNGMIFVLVCRVENKGTELDWVNKCWKRRMHFNLDRTFCVFASNNYEPLTECFDGMGRVDFLTNK